MAFPGCFGGCLRCPRRPAMMPSVAALSCGGGGGGHPPPRRPKNNNSPPSLPRPPPRRFLAAFPGGAAARVLKSTAFGLIGDIIVGVIGGYIGTWLWDVLRLPSVGGFPINAIVTSTAGAIVLLVLLRLIRS